jgi:hypothetical protein
MSLYVSITYHPGFYEVQVHNDAFVDSGPVQVSNNIDVYLQPLIDDLLVLWEKEGVRMWDEFQ